MIAPKFVLASASPRRRDLFRLLNIPFEATSTEVDETPQECESAVDLVGRLSRAKALAARPRYPHCIIIGADTDGELDGSILGKPRDEQQAHEMLRALRSREHIVHGAVTISFPTALTEQETLSAQVPEGMGRQRTIHVRTRVWMRDYSDAEIEAYVATGDPLDKAAGYAVQHPQFRPVARFEGCFANVMGLPLCRLWEALETMIRMPEPCLGCHLHPDLDCTVENLVRMGEIRGN